MSLATYDIRRLQFFRAGIKETKRSRLYALAFVFCTAFILGAVEINHDVGIYDEGIMLTGAMRVAQGALPHRDFYANYGPGQFFTLAAIFKLFGPSILIERIWDLVVKASIACLVNVIASSLMGRLPATAVTAACILWLAVLGFPSYPVSPSLFFILLGILPLFRLFDGRYSVAGLLAAGLCIGFVVLFRYDVGFFACAAESAVLTAFGFFRRPEAKTRFRHIAALLFPFWIGTALVVVPLFIAYAVTGIIPDFIFQILEYPSKNYAAIRSLPFPGFDPTKGIGQINSSSIVYFPPLVFLASLAGSARLHGSAAVGGQRALSSGWGWKLGVLSALVFTLYLKGLVRVSANSYGAFSHSGLHHLWRCRGTGFWQTPPAVSSIVRHARARGARCLIIRKSFCARAFDHSRRGKFNSPYPRKHFPFSARRQKNTKYVVPTSCRTAACTLRFSLGRRH